MDSMWAYWQLVWGFSNFIIICNIEVAEIWVVLKGIKITNEKDHKKVERQSDNKTSMVKLSIVENQKFC